MVLDELCSQRCDPKAPGLTAERIAELLSLLAGWETSDGELTKTFLFDSYYQTIAFVNAIAFIAHREDHHPDLFVGYNRCRIRYSTHSVGGLSLNDFICAGKVERLM